VLKVAAVWQLSTLKAIIIFVVTCRVHNSDAAVMVQGSVDIVLPLWCEAIMRLFMHVVSWQNF